MNEISTPATEAAAFRIKLVWVASNEMTDQVVPFSLIPVSPPTPFKVTNWVLETGSRITAAVDPVGIAMTLSPVDRLRSVICPTAVEVVMFGTVMLLLPVGSPPTEPVSWRVAFAMARCYPAS